MYNVSISFGTSGPSTVPSVVLEPNTLSLVVLVTDFTTGAPIGGLTQGQFTIHAFVAGKGEPVLPLAAGGFFEFATLVSSNYPSASLLPGVYYLQIDFPVAPVPVAGSVAFAVTVADINPTPVIAPIRLPTVMGVGVATYLSLTGKN